MRHLPAAVSLLVLFAAPASASEWLLTYAASEERRIESPDGTAPPRTEARSYTEIIALAEDTLVVQDDHQKFIRDFPRHRFIALNLADHTYDDWSLFSTVDFYAAELFNRNALGAAMRATKVTSAAALFDRFDNETALRLESRAHPLNPAKPAIEEVKLDHGIEFRCRGQTAVRFIASDTALPVDLQHRFANYLAYSCAIHPEIRRTLVAAAVLPQELVFTWRNGNQVITTTLRLVSARSSDTDSAALPPGATPALKDDAISQLLATIQAAERTGRRPTHHDAVTFADSAIAAGRPLDGLMALLEYQLQSGKPMHDELRRHRAKFDQDSSCQIYLKSFGQSSQGACEDSLAANARIPRANLQRAYMLELQRANHLDRLGKGGEAQTAYLAVLRANPFHAGALHDLGQLLSHHFDYANAWRCWDTARRLYPDHPMLKDVAAREQQLYAENPDFF